MNGGTLPSTDEDDARQRIVLHVDMDCFYASCERLREPSLEGEPVVVGMGYESGEGHGAVATASYEAREYGVESAQPISRALDALPRIEEVPDDEPGGHYRPVDMRFYEEIAGRAKEVLHDCADVVREVSIDEAYLDVTERTAWDIVGEGASPASPAGAARTLAEGYARHVKERIDREVGVPASVGVAPNMSTAKVASDHDKPDGLVVVRPGEVREFLAPLSVEAVHGVGPVTARELREIDVETAGDLSEADPAALRERFGERGRALYDRARGRDDREVTPTGRPKSLSRESAFTAATADPTRWREKVRALAAEVAERAKREDALYRTIGVKVVTPPFEVNTRARSLSGPVDDPALVEEVALSLLEEFVEAEADVRKLGVRVSNLSFADADQSSLDGWDAAGESRSDTGAGTDAGIAEGADAADTADAADAADTADAADADASADRSDRGASRDIGGDGQISLDEFGRNGDWDSRGDS